MAQRRYVGALAMTAALSWLNDLMQWFGRLVPRPVLVRATHAAVRFSPGGSAALLMPGLIWYWPIVQDVEIVSTQVRTLATSPQLHDSNIIGVTVTYRVGDPLKVLTTVNDPMAYLDQRTQTVLGRVYAEGIDTPALAALLREVLQQECESCGLTIVDVGVTQRSWVLPIKQVSDYSWHEDTKK
jgi:regulator of protease activity HflC (stomatin/prohibitin superfamily)